MIFWDRRLFAGRSSVVDGDESIEASVSFPPSVTLLAIFRPIYLILSSLVSTAAVLIVLHVWLQTYTTMWFSPSPSPIFPLLLATSFSHTYVRLSIFCWRFSPCQNPCLLYAALPLFLLSVLIVAIISPSYTTSSASIIHHCNIPHI